MSTDTEFNDALRAAAGHGRQAGGDLTAEQLNKAIRARTFAPTDLPAEHAAPETKRRQVAGVVGLPEVLADRLRGDTVEELVADAESLLAAAVGTEAPTPAADFDGGARSSAPAEPVQRIGGTPASCASSRTHCD